MDDGTKTFGTFLQSRRHSLMTLRDFAERVEKSPGYISDVENDRRDPPVYETLQVMIKVLNLSDADKVNFFDLAGKGRQEVSPDLPDYIMNSDVAEAVRLALRTARDNAATTDDWLKFADDIRRKRSE